MSYPIIWKCCVCKEKIATLKKYSSEFHLSSYRLVGDNRENERICVVCYRSKHNFQRKGKVG